MQHTNRTSSFDAAIEWSKKYRQKPQDIPTTSNMWKYMIIGVAVLAVLVLFWIIYSLWRKKGSKSSRKSYTDTDDDSEMSSSTGDDRSDDERGNQIVAKMVDQSPTEAIPITGNTSGRPVVSSVQIPPVATSNGR